MMLRLSRSMLRACTAIALVSVSCAAPALAQEAAQQGTATPLKKISVKGKRIGVTDTPVATTVEAEAIADRQVTDINDLGRTLEPGVNFNRTTGAVNIRGLEGVRVLTTIDGIPVPYLQDATRDADGGVDSFDFSSLASVSVVRGADSSRGGSGALGGILALSTLEPEDLIRDGKDWGGAWSFTYDSADTSFSPTAAFAKSFGDTAILVQGGYRRGHERKNQGTIDTYGTTRTEANPSDYDQNNVLVKLRHHAEGGHMFGVTAERYRKDRDTDARTSQSLTGNYRPGNYTTTDDSDRDRLSLDYAFEAEEEGTLFDRVAASVYWMNQLRGNGYIGYRSTSVIGPIVRDNTYDEKTWGAVGTAEKALELGGLEHRFSFGWDLATSSSEQYSAGADNCRLPYTGAFTACANLHTNQADTPKVESNRIGLSLEDRIALGTSGFTLTPGARFDWIEHSPVMTEGYANNANRPALPAGFDDTAISPKLRLGYQPSETVELYAQWAMGFRAPTAGELYAVFGGPGTYLRLGNPALQSETSNGIELGANIGDDDLGARVSAFYNRYRNFIDPRALNAAEAAAAGYTLAAYPQGGITQYSNIAKAEIYGAELSAHKRFDNGITLRGAVAYARGNDLTNDTFLASVAPTKVVLGIDYDAGEWGVGLDWIGVAAARGQTVSSGSNVTYFKTPGYGIVDLSAWWEPEQFKGLKVNAGIFNVLDKTYYDYSSVRNGGSMPSEFYSEPGRTFKISLSQKF
nr:TonB-dependent hemoglobin/transferrin/lactoferrin family receptor [Rhizobium sp. RU20A]